MTDPVLAPRPAPKAKSVRNHYVVTVDAPLYLIGAFDAHVTVLSQQIRALNLAWALLESSALPTKYARTKRTGSRQKLAIVGTGFAGMTLAAALLRKHADIDITLFEERDTLLPLQQGSDSRWIHPQIYDWPAEGSDASAAMLPVLNWTAGRASDVVVQILAEWARVLREDAEDSDNKDRQVRLFCDTRHLQIARSSADPDRISIEWVGEQRKVSDGTAMAQLGSAGLSETFDHVVLAVGFGLERGEGPSYWRNESLGQPNLQSARTTFLVSGQGDGAMIDLLRIRIAQYRQDRILDELFAGKAALLEALRDLRDVWVDGRVGDNLFHRLETLGGDDQEIRRQREELIGGLRRRLRRDTDAILKLKVRSLADLFRDKTSRISFQNAVLVYFLYRCGGFSPSREEVKDIAARLAIKPTHIIERHGTDRLGQYKRMLSDEFYAPVDADRETPSHTPRMRQDSAILWPGGYFGMPGRLSEASRVGSGQKKTWRKEYLPGPTSLLATTLCGALAGAIRQAQPTATQFRVTLHRVLKIHEEEELLQQSCEYLGPGLKSTPSGAGRTFPSRNATIGQAYLTRQIVRSVRNVDPNALRTAMKSLNLEKASSRMSDAVGFVLAIPIVQPDTRFFKPSPVAGVIYVDSAFDGFWLSDSDVEGLTKIVSDATAGLLGAESLRFDRLRNVQLSNFQTAAPVSTVLPDGVRGSLELLTTPPPPVTSGPFHFNFEHSDLTPLIAVENS